MTDSIEELCCQLAQQQVYHQYARSLKAANMASPIEMPKADGLLAHAYKELKNVVKEQCPDDKTCDTVMAALKKRALA